VKSSRIALLLSVSLGFFGAFACGGKSDVSSNQASGGRGEEGGTNAGGFSGSGAGPATHRTQCESLCARTAKIDGCTDNTLSCQLLCTTVTGYPSCQKQIDSWLKCSEDSAITCDESGVPNFADCENELLLAGSCAMTAEPPVAVKNSCEDFCTEVEVSGCTLDSQLGDCTQACGLSGTVVAACQTAFVDYLKCQLDTGVTCDESGVLAIDGCDSTRLKYLGCMLTEMAGGADTE
jgi:hypothetical protein